MYKYFHYLDKDGKNTISALSTYAGRPVKGYAKCDPRDEFDFEAGKELAAARCNAKVARKRRLNADRRLEEAKIAFIEAQYYLINMMNYYNDAVAAERVANEDVEKLLENL